MGQRSAFHRRTTRYHQSSNLAWWTNREENDRAWKVPAAELLANGCNRDRKNPQAKEDIAHLPPEQLAASILQKEQRIAEIMGNIRTLLAKGPTE